MLEKISLTANGRELLFFGSEPDYLKYCLNWNPDGGSVHQSAKDIPRGSVCLDVGANIGITAITLAAQRPDCHVIAFEPVPANLESLRHNIEANGLKNVEAIAAAVSDRHGSVRMRSNGPWSSVWPDGTIDIPCVPLDDYADRDVAFMKIDTEGHEPQVLSGARKLLARSRPLVHMEWNSLCLIDQHCDLKSFAKAVGASFEILAFYDGQDKSLPVPKRPFRIVYENMVMHGCINDLLMRPKAEMPSLQEMTCSPDHLALIKSR